MTSTGQGVRDNNMYAYCTNNPVNRFDKNGNWSLPNWVKNVAAAAAIVVVSVVVAAAVVAAAPAVAGAVAATAGAYGASAAVAGALATATSVGCSGVAVGVMVTGTNRAVQSITGINYGAEILGENTYNTVESTINFAAMMIISVPQTTPYPSTGRSEPANLKEQVGMNLTQANPDKGTVIIPYLKDSRMPGWLGWQKYQMHFEGTGITIHYVGNKILPVYFDFKFK